jgi:hypothetical protein
LVVTGLGYIFDRIQKRFRTWRAVNSCIEYIVPCDVRVEIVRFGLLFEFRFQLSQLLGIFLSQIDSFRVVVVEVIELPCVFIKRPFAGGISSEEAAGISQFSFLPVIINRSRPEDVVILLRVAGWRLGIVDRVCQ